MLIYDAKVLNCHSQRGRHYAVLPDGRVAAVNFYPPGRDDPRRAVEVRWVVTPESAESDPDDAVALLATGRLGLS